MFAKVNTKVRLYGPPNGIMVEVQVVTITSIGPSAGAFAGTRTTSPARITHVMTMALIASCLFKSVLSSVGFDVGYNPEAPSIPIS